ncbi:MAG: HD domain-containing protein [Longimicrobiaceae bacterium]
MSDELKSAYGGASPGDREVAALESARKVEDRFAHRLMLNTPTKGNAKVERLIELVNGDDELYALWIAENVTAVERLGMTDHGPVHVKIVMNIAVKLLRMLVDAGVEPGVVKSYGLTRYDAEVVVVLAALLHDVGMSIHRTDHEAYSLFVAQEKIKSLLGELYEARTATLLRAEVLHAIIAHRSKGRPLTLEAGVVRVADALDMAKGRSRISIAGGSTSIHSVSAAAVEAVRIEPGDEKPVRLRIKMSNPAGVFQLDQLFRDKLAGSGLQTHIELEAELEGDTEKRLMDGFRL